MPGRYSNFVFVVFLTCAVLLSLAGIDKSSAQIREVRVAQGVGTLNEAIDSDTTATGERAGGDSTTVYVLESGGIYLLSGSIENRFPLTIVAEDGWTERPRLIPGVDDGGSSGRPFRARGDLTLRGLYITNEDELGARNTRIVRISADSIKVSLDQCHLDKDGQSGFRFDNDFVSVWLTNSIMSNIGTMESPNNGRGFDDRGNPIDTLFVENCTFYNLTSRVLRDDGGIINYAHFNHNTLVNIGQRGVTFGEVVSASFTNNLLINTSFLGSAALGDQELATVSVDTLLDVTKTQTVDIRNNNIYNGAAVVAALPDTVDALVNFGPLAQFYVDQGGAGATIISDATVFNNGPAAPVDVITSFFDPAATNIEMDTAGEPFDYLYPNTTASFTGSTAGQPLGDLNWFGLDIIPGGTPAPVHIREVRVAQGVGTLNEAIDSDTTATGERAGGDSTTVYVLESGGIYILSGSIENRFPLTIVAEDGWTERPRLIPGVDDGGSSGRPFRARGDLTLRGLYITNEDELGARNTRIVRISADSVKIKLDQCHLDKDGQSGFRFDNDFVSVWLTNSIMSNIGTMESPNNGRGFDDRGNPIDTLFVENCTFYNLTSRVLRDDGGIINYAHFNHNTLVNIGQRGVTFGEVVSASFTNNLLINTSFLGSAALGDQELATVSVDTLLDVTKTQTVDIRNNNIYSEAAVVAALPDTVDALVNFGPLAQFYVDQGGAGATITSEATALNNGPAAPVDVITSFFDPAATNIEMDTAGEPFDFLYPNTTASFTGSTAGQPLGDLNWFGLDIITSVAGQDGGGEQPESFGLLSNYPNPFNPSTNIVYTLSSSATVKLAIYNMLGQRVVTLVAGEAQLSGQHTVQWDGKDDIGNPVSSGVYLYRIEAGELVETSKMMLLK